MPQGSTRADRLRRIASLLALGAALRALPAGAEEARFALRSSAFPAQGAIPARYTCEGDDLSPPLSWSAVPEGTQSFALIVADPDAPDPRAPRTTWIHWVVYDLPAGTRALSEGAGAGALPAGARGGTNDWNKQEWAGPCPPIGRHRYVFKLYALDSVLKLKKPTKRDLEDAMQGHIVGQATLIGTYEKKSR